MDLIKAYANKVASYLPAKQRASMRDEIYADLADEFDDYSATPEDFLADKPHPMKYAAALAEPNQAYLIGPQFYFSYVETLKGAAAIVSIIFIGLGLLEVGTSGELIAPLLSASFSLLQALIWTTAAITGIFIALERSGERASWLDNWQTDSLTHWQSAQTISRTTIAFELGMSLILLAWLMGLFQFPTFIWHEGQRIEDWQLLINDGLRWAFIALLIVDVVQALWQLFEPVWSSAKRWVRIGFNGLWILALLFAWAQPDKIQLMISPLPDNLASLEALFNQLLNWGLLGAAALVLWDSIDLLIKSRKNS